MQWNNDITEKEKLGEFKHTKHSNHGADIDPMRHKTEYGSATVSTGNTFQDLPRLCETADNTERYI
jgi:hypothetical protein